MIIDLTIKDRLLMGSLFPQKGDILTQLLVRDIARKVEVSQEEVKEVGLRTQGNQMSWDESKAVPIKVEFTDLEIKFLADQAARLDGEKAVTVELLGLILKIQGKE